MKAFLTRCKNLWQAIVHPVDVYKVYMDSSDKMEGNVPKEVWDRVNKAFKRIDEVAFKEVDEAFKEIEAAFDKLKKK